MDSVKFSRPSSTRRVSGRYRQSIDELVHRQEYGLDLWTGEPLVGRDADDWLRNAYKMTDVRKLSEVEEEELFEAHIELQRIAASI